jgi:hypothetical protein
MMKNSILISIALLISITSFAKKVKFEVDMTDQTISTYGVHVSGDFQALAGYAGGDWQPGTTALINESGTQIYGVIVDIPAFAKYEYKFLNGDQWYDSEFVPWESRVGYNFNDNRWIYVDSIANDTTSTLPLIYSGNAPQGLKLLRFKVDLQKEDVLDPAGVHVAGSFQGWNAAIYRLYDFDTTIYDYMAYVEQGSYEYKYYNGNTVSSSETVPDECSVNGNRWVNVVNDTILEVVCFAECSFCVITEINQFKILSQPEIYPNPASASVVIKFNDGYESHNIVLLDISGMVKQVFTNYSASVLEIETSNYTKGIYIIKTEDKFNRVSYSKLILE